MTNKGGIEMELTTPAPPAPTQADAKRGEQLKAALDTMESEYIVCRDLSHAWKNFGPKWIKQDHMYEQILRCTRCDTQKFRYLSVTGHIISSHYEYAEGYLLPRGFGRLTTDDRDAIRLADLKQHATPHLALA